MIFAVTSVARVIEKLVLSLLSRLDNRNRAIGKSLTPQYSKERKKELLFGAQ